MKKNRAEMERRSLKMHQLSFEYEECRPRLQNLERQLEKAEAQAKKFEQKWRLEHARSRFLLSTELVESSKETADAAFRASSGIGEDSDAAHRIILKKLYYSKYY